MVFEMCDERDCPVIISWDLFFSFIKRGLKPQLEYANAPFHSKFFSLQKITSKFLFFSSIFYAFMFEITDFSNHNMFTLSCKVVRHSLTLDPFGVDNVNNWSFIGSR